MDGVFGQFVSRETVRSRSCHPRSRRRGRTVSRETIRPGRRSVSSCRLCRPGPWHPGGLLVWPVSWNGPAETSTALSRDEAATGVCRYRRWVRSGPISGLDNLRMCFVFGPSASLETSHNTNDDPDAPTSAASTGECATRASPCGSRITIRGWRYRRTGFVSLQAHVPEFVRRQLVGAGWFPALCECAPVGR